MPFEGVMPRAFMSGSIQMYAPVAPGIYGISNASEWIYIGEANNIQRALFAHLQDRGSSLMKREPAGFVFEICDGTRRSIRTARLIDEYAPTCNPHARESSHDVRTAF